MLCADCVQKGHALFTCALCGERALPLHEETTLRPRGPSLTMEADLYDGSGNIRHDRDPDAGPPLFGAQSA